MKWLRRALIAALSLVALTLLLEFTAYPRGRLAARWDHSRGHYQILTYGYPIEWSREYRRLLSERYGVETYGVANCVITTPLKEYANGYNEVSVPRIESKFGRDIFAECARDAEMIWRNEHPNR